MALPEMYFSVAIAANGPIPGEYSMVALGATVVGRPQLVYFAEIKPISDGVDPETLKASGLTMEHVLEKGQDPVESMQRFDAWVRSTAGTTHRPVFVGFNAPFDWMYVHWYLIRLVGSNPFGPTAVDIRAYYMGMMGAAWDQTDAKDVMERFPPKRPRTQNALDAALMQAEIFEQILEFQATRVP